MKTRTIVLFFSLAISGCNPEVDKESIWDESPFVATVAPMDESNDLVFWFSEDESELNLEARKAALTRISDWRYDLECEQGQFRVTLVGDTFVPESQLFGRLIGESDFELVSRCFLMNYSSQDKGLWLLRSQIYPHGLNKNKKFSVFDESTKKGFFSGSLLTETDHEGSSLYVFDETGEQAVRFIALAPKASEWSDLGKRVVVRAKIRGKGTSSGSDSAFGFQPKTK